MLDKLLQIESTYNTIQGQLMDPEVLSDQKKLIELNKKAQSLQETYDIFQEYKKYLWQKKEAEELMVTETDADTIEMAKEQLTAANEHIAEIEPKLRVSLLPKDPMDDKNIFLEIRPAAGGDEAWLFAAELLKAYMLYAQKKWRKTEIVEQVYSDVWGIKFAMVKMSGDHVYSQMKFESGVHRVQRIPATESQWRVHTSTITVAIMPEVENVEFTIDPKDIHMDTYAASSAGGQNANKNQTWVRLHHIPTGTIVNIWDSKSQMQNKEKAYSVLKARLYQVEQDKKMEEERKIRGDQIWWGDRSEKIRTYNFPQDRVTDHRIKQSRGNIPGIMMGDFDDIIHALIVETQAEQLKAEEE